MIFFNSKEYKEKMKHLKPLFEVGDKVKVLEGRSNMIGETAFITKITENDKDLVVKEGQEYCYYIDNEERYYSWAHFFELDKEWGRDKKLKQILNGLS